MNQKRSRCWAGIVACFLMPHLIATTLGAEFYVAATGGNDANPGTRNQPFATLEKARSAVQALKTSSGLPAGGVVVWLRGGLYLRNSTFALGAADSGESGKPVIYASYPGENARVAGAKQLDLSLFSTVTSASPVWNRLDPAARGNVSVTSLPAQGITDYGTLKYRGFSGSVSAALELFADGKPLPLARWPDADQDDAPASPADSTVTLYGVTTPNVCMTYSAYGMSDGVQSYKSNQLINGKSYYLYRNTWTYLGTSYTAWFLAPQSSGYPGNPDPFWYRYNPSFGPMSPANGGVGTLTTESPLAIHHGFANVTTAVNDTTFTFAGSRLQRWSTAPDMWVHGFFKYLWADSHVAVTSVTPATNTLVLAQSPTYGTAANMPFYVENLLEEITQPGEWYVDRTNGLLYAWIPNGTTELLASTLDAPAISQLASYVRWQDVTIEATRNVLVQLSGDHSQVLRCELRNSGMFTTNINGSDNEISRCHIHDSGDDGVRISAGSRKTLTRGNNVVSNCEIHNFGRWSWTYHPAVTMAMCGQSVVHNLIHHAPHTAIMYTGNEHTAEFNDIHDVCQYTSDAGAIYSGRDWSYRGNRIRTNFIHNVYTSFGGSDVHGVYLDDCVSGIEVYGNILYKVAGRGIGNHGGRDNILTNNIMVRCGVAGMAADDRGLTWINNVPNDSWNFLQRLTYDGVQYQQNPWATAYPLLAAIPNDWNTVSAPGALWRAPEGCVFSRNLGFSNATFMRWESASAAFGNYKEIADNIANQDPLFVDEAGGDLTLRPDSPALTIPGFVTIPFKQIGIEPEPAAPVVAISASPTGGTDPLTVVFSGTPFSVPAGAISMWNWDFGDGATGDGAQPAHTYAATGVYTATVMAMDNNGRVGTASVVISVSKAPDVVSGPWADANPVTLPSTTTVHVVASDPDKGPKPLTYSWSMVSGPAPVTFTPNGTAASNDSKTSFSAPGTYTLSVIVSDGATSVSALLTVVVLPAVGDPGGGGTGGGDPGAPIVPPVLPLEMKVSQLKGAVNFTKIGLDSCSIRGVLPNFPATSIAAGQTATLNISGAEVTFVLNAKGRGKSAHGTLLLKLKQTKDKSGKPHFAGGNVPFTAKISKGTWSGIWNLNPGAGTTTMPVTATLAIGGATYTATVTASRKSGRFWTP